MKFCTEENKTEEVVMPRRGEKESRNAKGCEGIMRRNVGVKKQGWGFDLCFFVSERAKKGLTLEKERIAHACSFVKSDESDSFTVAVL